MYVIFVITQKTTSHTLHYQTGTCFVTCRATDHSFQAPFVFHDLFHQKELCLKEKIKLTFLRLFYSSFSTISYFQKNFLHAMALGYLPKLKRGRD